MLASYDHHIICKKRLIHATVSAAAHLSSQGERCAKPALIRSACGTGLPNEAAAWLACSCSHLHLSLCCCWPIPIKQGHSLSLHGAGVHPTYRVSCKLHWCWLVGTSRRCGAAQTCERAAGRGLGGETPPVMSLLSSPLILACWPSKAHTMP